MKFSFLIALIAIQFHSPELQAQGYISLKYAGKLIVPNDKKVDDSKVGGLSGISFNSKDSTYYVVADKPPSRIYRLSIDANNGLNLDFLSVINLKPALLSKSELEGIAIDRVLEVIYVADEQGLGTRIFEIDTLGNFNRIITPLNKPFIPLSGDNSGIEGLAISDDGLNLYYAFERPHEACLDDSKVLICHMDLKSRTLKKSYHYEIHAVEGDKLNTNGISEILYLNDSSLLVMERAYIRGSGNVVRLFQVALSKQIISSGKSCSATTVFKTIPHLVFDFADVTDFAIDNAEGMTFNADQSQVIIVTDNNFSKNQQTQIVFLEVIN